MIYTLISNTSTDIKSSETGPLIFCFAFAAMGLWPIGLIRYLKLSGSSGYKNNVIIPFETYDNDINTYCYSHGFIPVASNSSLVNKDCATSQKSLTGCQTIIRRTRLP